MPTPTKLQSGDGSRLTATFKDIAGAVADPTTVKFHAKKPDGTAIDYTYPTDAELVRESQGVYHVDLTHDSAGEWTREFHGTGGGIEAVEIRHAIVSASLSVPG